MKNKIILKYLRFERTSKIIFYLYYYDWICTTQIKKLLNLPSHKTIPKSIHTSLIKNKILEKVEPTNSMKEFIFNKKWGNEHLLNNISFYKLNNESKIKLESIHLKNETSFIEAKEFIDKQKENNADFF